MPRWWHRRHELRGQDAQWIELRRALDPLTASTEIRRKSDALLERSAILREQSASLRAYLERLRLRARILRRILLRKA
jgi:hypothetical protein